MVDLALFWHRRDLRLQDNVGLAAAWDGAARVVGLFCLDPEILTQDTMAPARVHYMLESLRELQECYQASGSQLLVVHAAPQETLPRLATSLSIAAVYWNQDVEPYARGRDRLVQEALQAQGIPVHTFWDQVLHPPGDVLTTSEQPYTVYTPFWHNWHSQAKAAPVNIPQNLEGLTPEEQAIAQDLGVIPIPTAEDLGFSWQGTMILSPGTQAAQTQLEDFCDRSLTAYQEQRNFPPVAGTSLLSPALKFGTIGIRTVWAKSTEVAEASWSDEAKGGIQTWQKELAWREFYQHVLYFYPELASGPYREPLKAFPWDDQEDHFQAWCRGQTGYPIVDAAMHQLQETGWMHNRCRMIVASFLTKDLLINWQWGEKYFMQNLVDGDLAANNGGWQWSASSGMDPRPLRIFNPVSQAQKFDPDGEYIRQWLPQLRSLETSELVTGKITPGERDRCGYPAPIVDHHHQQRRFKERYQNQKAIRGSQS